MPSLEQSTESFARSRAFPEWDALVHFIRRWTWSRWLLGTTAGAMCWVGIAAFIFAVLVGWSRGYPRPMVHDEFSYLLAGELYSQFRWSAPTPPEPQFFETFHELTSPRRASKYPIAQGVCLAVGYWLQHPIVGVWLATGALAAALVWALRGYMPLRWAVVGALAGEALFGGTTYWAQSYWGGAMAAIGGALVWGAVRRLCLRPSIGVSVSMGAGVFLLLHSRPLEGGLFCVVPATILLGRAIRAWRRGESWSWGLVFLPAGSVLAAAIAVLAWSNAAVTGSATKLPYMEYDERYHTTRSLLWQESRPSPMDIPERMMRLDEEQVVPYARWPKPVWAEWSRRIISDGSQYFGPVLLLVAACGGLLGAGTWMRRAGVAMGICWISFLLTPWFLPHYQAPAAVTALVLGLAGLRKVARHLSPARARKFLIGAAACHLGFAAVRADVGRPNPAIVQSFERFDRVLADLKRDGARALVFVSYDPTATVHAEFTFNAASIEESQIVWARDLGERDALLIPHFPGRKIWRLHVAPAEMALQPLTVATKTVSK